MTTMIALGLAPAAAAGAVTVTRTDCARLVRYVPAPDVAYRPGVDVRGNPVAPANVDGAIEVEPLSEIRIPITVDMQRRFGIPANPDLYSGEAVIGTVTYDGNERSAYFNGQPLANDDTAAIAAACKKALRTSQ